MQQPWHTKITFNKKKISFGKSEAPGWNPWSVRAEVSLTSKAVSGDDLCSHAAAERKAVLSKNS